MGHVIYYFLKTNRFNVMNIGVQRGGGATLLRPFPFGTLCYVYTLTWQAQQVAVMLSKSFIVKYFFQFYIPVYENAIL